MKSSAISPNLLKQILGTGILRTALITFMLMVISLGKVSCQKTDQEVLMAFELRIQGKADQSKTILSDMVQKDSTNAAACFELARTLNYINIRGSAEADKALKSSIKADPANAIYAFYFAKNRFLKAYMTMEQGGDANEKINGVCNEFLKVSKMKPDYPIPLMYLVEIYGMLPENMGGNRVKAEEYTQKLEKMDRFYGAKARLVMMPEGTNMAEYWNKYIAKNGDDFRAYKELGVAYLFTEDVAAAEKSFEKAISLDKSQNVRSLDLARYHMMKVMKNKDAAATEIPKSKVFLEKYLASVPEPIAPLKAFALGLMSVLEQFQGNNEKAEKYLAEANTLDPHFWRIMGIPALTMFDPPNKLDFNFQSFFSPY